MKEERGTKEKLKFKLHRNDVHKWFVTRIGAPNSSEWPKLLLVMTAMDAGWTNLGELPEEAERRIGGWIEAIITCRREDGDFGNKVDEPWRSDTRIHTINKNCLIL